MAVWPFSSQVSFNQGNQQVRGRFAPSPSGPLHFGSLVAAVGSYLHAKANNGLWFVRIEDIDTSRVDASAQGQILDALDAFGLHWDVDLQTQSQLQNGDRNCLKQTARISRYQEVLDFLESKQLVYGCACTRKEIKASGGLYQGTCRDKYLDLHNNPIRLKQTRPIYQFSDGIFGPQSCDPLMAQEDYIIKRRDGLFSYQLAVVVDDIDQGITHVVRGADIMPLTARQLSLYQTLEVDPPEFLHLPLAVTEPGHKLSKQNHAPAINSSNPQPELLKALSFLGYAQPGVSNKSLNLDSLAKASPQTILEWALEHWSQTKINQQTEIII